MSHLLLPIVGAEFSGVSDVHFSRFDQDMRSVKSKYLMVLGQEHRAAVKEME